MDGACVLRDERLPEKNVMVEKMIIIKQRQNLHSGPIKVMNGIWNK
jgi:hypothetical protein